MVEYHVGDELEILTNYVATHTPEREVFTREVASMHGRTPDEIHIHSWYPKAGRVEGGSYGTRWGSTFGN